MNNARTIYQTLRDDGGFTHEQAMGAMSNLLGESLDKGDVNTRGWNSGEAALGVAQWREGRQTNLRRFAAEKGLDVYDPRAQALFIVHELNTTEKAAGDRLRQARTLEEAAGAFIGFERPGGWSRDNPTWAPDLPRRIKLGRQFEARLTGVALPTIGDDVDPSASLRDTLNSQKAGWGDQVIKDNPFLEKYPTVGAYRDWRTAREAEAAKRASLGTGAVLPTTSGDVKSPSVMPDYERRDIERENEKKWGRAWYEDTWDAVSQQPTIRDTGRLITGNSYEEDPNFRMTKDLHKEVTKGLPEEYWGKFSDARSESHAAWIRQELEKEMDRQRRYASGGGGYAFGMNLLEGAADIPSLALGLGVGKVAAIGASTRRAIIAREALGAALGNAVSEVPSAFGNPLGETSDIAVAAGLGLVLGAGSGFLSSKSVAREAAALEEIGRRAAGLPTAGSAGDAGAAFAHGVDSLNANAADWIASAESFSGPAFGKARYDVSATLQRSENPVTRALGANLVEDAVGKRGEVSAIAVSEWQGKLLRSWEHTAASEVEPLFEKFAEAKGWNWFEKEKGRSAFNEAVVDAIRATDPTTPVDPHIAKAADVYRKLVAEIADTARNPGVLDGTTRRAVKGFDEIEENPNYVPRIVDRTAVAENIDRFGTRQVEDLFHQAIRGFTPDLDDEIARRVAKGYVKRISEMKAGLEGGAAKTLKGGDYEALRDLLHGIDGATDGDVERIIAAMSKRDDSDAGKVSRAKRRTPIDENFTMAVRDRHTGQTVDLRVADFFEKDAGNLFNQYARLMSGQVAMSLLRIKNPKFAKGTVKKTEEFTKIENGKLVRATREVEVDADPTVPEFLVDGVTSRGEWDTLMNRVKQVQDEMDPSKVDAAMTDVDRLQTVYGLITGGPIDGQWKNATASQWARRVRDLNYIRLMNRVGLAQVPELGNVVGTLGVRATVGSLPVVRKIISDAKGGKLDPQFIAELDHMLSPGTDHLRSLARDRVADVHGDNLLAGNRVEQGIDTALQYGKRVTSTISGFRHVDSALQNLAARGFVAKMVDTIFDTGPSFSMTRLNSFGIDDDLFKRIKAQAEKHAGSVEGAVSGTNIRTLGLDNWTDQEARAAFEMAAYRATRKIVQQNDIGNLPLFMHGDTFKLLTQFRSFMAGAWSKQTLYSLNMRDGEAAASFALSMALGAVVHTTKLGIKAAALNASGATDKVNELWEKEGSWSRMALAGFNLSGQASVIPAAWDTLTGVVGFKPTFDGFRNSGLASGAVSGNPVVSMVDKGLKGIGGLAQAPFGDKFTQAEAKGLWQLLPFQNALGLSELFGMLIDGLPEHNDAKRR